MNLGVLLVILFCFIVIVIIHTTVKRYNKDSEYLVPLLIISYLFILYGGIILTKNTVIYFNMLY